MPFKIIREDITKLRVDAIVNAANTSLQMGGGVCGAIFRAADVSQMRAACDVLAPIQTGEAVITSGFELPARYVIHTAGPVYNPRDAKQSEALLRDSYRNALHLALDNQCRSVAFPLISSGIYGYPKEEALQVATASITAFLTEYDMDVTLVVFDKSSFAVSRELLGEVNDFLNEHLTLPTYLQKRKLLAVEEEAIMEAVRFEEDMSGSEAAPEKLSQSNVAVPVAGLDEWIQRIDEPFAATLLRLIDARGKTDVEIYKRANLDRKLFSKIRTVKGYIPSKRTVIALAIALELNLDEAIDLLQRAGFALSHSQIADVIVKYFIVRGKFNIFEINEVLFQYDQPLLGG